MCRAGCKTQDHATWGECARASRLNIGYCGIGGGDATAQKSWDYELDLYRQARAEGIQPDATKLNKITEAMRLSDAAGMAYGKDFSKAVPVEVA